VGPTGSRNSNAVSRRRKTTRRHGKGKRAGGQSRVAGSEKVGRLITPNQGIVDIRWQTVYNLLPTALPVNDQRFKISDNTTVLGSLNAGPSTTITTIGRGVWAGFYESYRVLRMKSLVVRFANLETFPVYVAVMYTATDLGVINTLANMTATMQNPWSRAKVLGTVSSSSAVKTIRSRCNYSALLGDKQILFDDAYAAATGASPSSTVYANVLARTATGGNFVTGVDVWITATIEVELFDRVPLTQ